MWFGDVHPLVSKQGDPPSPSAGKSLKGLKSQHGVQGLNTPGTAQTCPHGASNWGVELLFLHDISRRGTPLGIELGPPGEIDVLTIRVQ